MIAPKKATSETTKLLVKACPKCEFTMAHGFRVYFTQRGMEIVILLAGGDKSSQTQDIALAHELARQLKE